MSLDEAREWFISLREHRNEEEIKKWITDECKCMLNLLCQKNDSDAYITGYKLLTPASKYHSSNRTEDVSKEIYEYLMKGKIVIIDLSVGNATLRDKTSKKIATYIFNKSMDMFTGKDINLEDLILLSKRLGHRDVKETLNTYSHLFPNAQKKILESIDEGAEM